MFSIYKVLLQQHYRPYTLYDVRKSTIITFIVSFLFLYAFKPITISEYKIESQLVIITFYSICAAAAYFIVTKIFKPDKKAYWPYLYEIALLLSTMVLAYIMISIGSIFLLAYLLKLITSIKEEFILPSFFFKEVLLYVGVIGGLIYMLINFSDLVVFMIYKKPLNITLGINTSIELEFKGKNKNEYLKINSIDLVCVKSQGHYVEINYIDISNYQLKTVVYRLNMKDVEKIVYHSSSIVRCHNSYFINLNFIRSLISNGKKWNVLVDHINAKIPVSQSKVYIVKEKLSKLENGLF
ncbi:LytTR family DNA-binding domain-containing protein [Aquimarina hainanensis]|uniref:LytTR family DNA-binding domain-containing protein n=2 Tax=Aquimarina hainanensis TaxID=1578017 RepID=A0ABW5NBN3_9FLAO